MHDFLDIRISPNRAHSYMKNAQQYHFFSSHKLAITIFWRLCYCMVEQTRTKRKTNIFNLEGNVYAFDSTTIDLCLEVFGWVKFRKHKGGLKIHSLYD